MEWVVFPINKIGWSTGSANVNLSCFTRISTEYWREKNICCIRWARFFVDVTMEKLSAKVIRRMIPDDHLWRWLNTLRYRPRLRLSEQPGVCILRAVKRSGKFCTFLVKCSKAFIRLSSLFLRELLPEKEHNIDSDCAESLVQLTPHTFSSRLQ